MSTPLSTIEFYKINGLSSNYRDSYYFDNVSDQYNHFHGTSGAKTLSYSQYTRVSNNKVKVPFPQSEMMFYNYMLIRNSLFTDSSSNNGKDIYCFIMNVEYVSDMCSLITFKVDVLQTFLPSATLKEAFVERCHSKTDEMFENREPEPFTIEQYVLKQRELIPIPCYAVIGVVSGTTFDLGGTQVTSSAYSYLDKKVFSGSQFYKFDLSDTTDLNLLQSVLLQMATAQQSAIQSYGASADSITDFYIVPQSSISNLAGGHAIGISDTGFDRSFNLSSGMYPTSSTTMGGSYVPKNKKLYNYPFCKLVATASTGDMCELKYEEFKYANHVPYFIENGNWFGGGEAILYPDGYQTNTGTYNPSYAVTISDFPKCSWWGDTYKTWLNQKMVAKMSGVATNLLSNALVSNLTMGVSPVLGAIASFRGIGSTLTDVGSVVTEQIEMSKKPNSFKGKNASCSIGMARDRFGWIFDFMIPNEDEAKQIDDYFTMFGYAQNKIININTYLDDFYDGRSRAKFVYLKCNGFSVQGNIPNEYKQEINDIFNSGITFWKASATIGDYSNNTAHSST